MQHTSSDEDIFEDAELFLTDNEEEINGLTNEIKLRNESQNLPIQNGRKRTKREPTEHTRKSKRERKSLDRLTYLNTTHLALNVE